MLTIPIVGLSHRLAPLVPQFNKHLRESSGQIERKAVGAVEGSRSFHCCHAMRKHKTN